MRAIIVIMVGLGSAAVATAAGLLYLDLMEKQTAREILALGASSRIVLEQAGQGVPATHELRERLEDNSLVFGALVTGASGAGLVGAGLTMALLRIRVFK